jgi:hypothetical protein
LPTPGFSYDDAALFRIPGWFVVNNMDTDARLEVRQGNEFYGLQLIPPHSWSTVAGTPLGHTDGEPDFSAHLLDGTCRELDSVPMVGWDADFIIVIAPGGTLTIDVWMPASLKATFSPPGTTFDWAFASAAVRCGLHVHAVTGGILSGSPT